MCLAIPGQMLSVDGETGLVEVSGVRRRIQLALLDGVQVGDWVLIHVGFAMSRIDESEAKATLELLREVGEAYLEELGDADDALR